MIYLKLFFSLFFLLLLCYCLGSFFSFFFLEKYKFPRILIGFYALLAIGQLFLWYPMLKRYSTDYMLYTYLLLSVLSFLFMMIVYLKQKHYLLPNKREILITLTVVIVCPLVILLFTNIENGAPDSLYYLGNMMENYSSEIINQYDGFSGYPGRLSNTYAYQSFYLLVTGLAKLFRVTPYLISIWVLPTLLVLIKTYLVTYFTERCTINKKFMCLFLFFTLVSYSDLIYASNGSMYKLPMFAIILVILDDLLKSNDTCIVKHSFILSGLVIAGIALHSSFLFQGTFIFVAFGIVLIMNNQSKKLFALLTPLFCFLGYVLFYINRPLWIKSALLPILIIYFLVFLLSKFSKFMNLFFKILGVMCCFALIVCSIGIIFKFGIFSNIQETLNASDFLYYFSPEGNNINDVAIAIVRALLFISTLIFSITKFKKSWQSTYVLVIFLFLFNPIVIYAISTFFTGEVYFRIDEIFIKNPYILFIISQNITFEKMKFQIVPITICILFFISSFSVKHFSINHFDFFYRIDKDLSDVLKTADLYVEKIKHPEYKVNLMSTDLRVRYFTNNAYFFFNGGDYRNLFTEDYLLNIILYRALTESDDYSDYNLIDRIIFDNKLDIIIMDNKQTNKLYTTIEKYCENIKQNEGYRLYGCKYY